ncbi:conserved hypothetical protein [Leishmania braziliensis MHOM/BR/75/M2904]|uniref:Uncharacterized protein n=2 Tax=Leishmania braziliensis TaxID=5660 RepID=A4H8N4_LEIBR|nr:conserved hypothetical protein [Leishmania braziliensis MHOM/BR/75/M2904]CAJ2469731.1 unnamed protein product [Leishmania braziliensis]CAM37750.1 conserved hypothetical protein [Leishmania braziliensis MHOM/BR/75/M2904]SYZ64390.1 hypothetical_protein [Leishmania braziliensis MHOM/BR/75/M2904]
MPPPPPPPPVSNQHGTPVEVASVTTESVSSQPTWENIRLLQGLVQLTRCRRRVQPQFETFSLDEPDYIEYNLKGYGPQDLGDGDAVAYDRSARRQIGSDSRGDATVPAAQSLRSAGVAPPSPSAADGGPYHMGPYNVGRDRQPRCQARTAQSPPALPGAVCRGTFSRDHPSPGRGAEEEEEWDTSLSGLHGVEGEYSDSGDGAGAAYDREAHDDACYHSKRPSPQHPKGQPHEYSSSWQPSAENSSRRPFTSDTRAEREKRQPGHYPASNSHRLSSDGGARWHSGHDGCGDAATAERQGVYDPRAGEYNVESSHPQFFQGVLPVTAQRYERLPVAGANGGPSGTIGNDHNGEVHEGEGFDDGDGAAGWEDALDEWDGDEAAGGEEWRGRGDGAYRSHDDGTEGEPSYHRLSPSSSKAQQTYPPQRAALPVEASAPLLPHPCQRFTRGVQWEAANVSTLQPPMLVEGDARRLSRWENKKRRSKHNPRAFQNRTTYTWVSTNTVTSVMLPPVTVQLVPMPTCAMTEEGHSVDGRWAGPAAAFSPPSPHTLSSTSVSGYQQRRSQMEVLDDSAESSSKTRNLVGNSLPYLPRRNKVEQGVVYRSMPQL